MARPAATLAVRSTALHTRSKASSGPFRILVASAASHCSFQIVCQILPASQRFSRSSFQQASHLQTDSRVRKNGARTKVSGAEECVRRSPHRGNAKGKILTRRHAELQQRCPGTASGVCGMRRQALTRPRPFARTALGQSLCCSPMSSEPGAPIPETIGLPQ